MDNAQAFVHILSFILQFKVFLLLLSGKSFAYLKQDRKNSILDKSKCHGTKSPTKNRGIGWSEPSKEKNSFSFFFLFLFKYINLNHNNEWLHQNENHVYAKLENQFIEEKNCVLKF